MDIATCDHAERWRRETTEIHDRQSSRIANILATNLREAKTIREGTLDFEIDRSSSLEIYAKRLRVNGRKPNGVIL